MNPIFFLSIKTFSRIIKRFSHLITWSHYGLYLFCRNNNIIYCGDPDLSFLFTRAAQDELSFDGVKDKVEFSFEVSGLRNLWITLSDVTKCDGFTDVRTFFLTFNLNTRFAKIDDKVPFYYFLFFDQLICLLLRLFSQVPLQSIIKKVSALIEIPMKFP